MNRRSLGAATLVVGVVLVLLAALGDTLGIGGQSGFGWKQAVMLGAGAVIALVGAAMLAGLIKPATEDTGEASSRGEGPRLPRR